MTEVQRLVCQVADLQDEVAKRDKRIEELEEENEALRNPWRGPDRKTRLERGWQR